MKNLTDQQKTSIDQLKNDAPLMANVRSEYYDMTDKFLKRNFDCELHVVAVSEFLTIKVFAINGIYLIVDYFNNGKFLFQKMTKAHRIVKEWFVDYETNFEFFSDTDYFGDIENYNQ